MLVEGEPAVQLHPQVQQLATLVAIVCAQVLVPQANRRAMVPSPRPAAAELT